MVAVVFLDSQGGFQRLEWATLDYYLRLSRPEPPETPIVLVTIDQSDLRELGGWPISDRILAETLENLQNGNPAVIGLNLYRDLPVPPSSEALEQLMVTLPNLVGIYKHFGRPTPPPPILARRGLIGFGDVLPDFDGKIRRSLLSHVDEQEGVQLSFAARVSLMYLQRQHNIEARIDPQRGLIQVGQARFTPRRQVESGQGLMVRSGYQVVMTCRGPHQNFQVVSIRDLLANPVPANSLEGNVVLIGGVSDPLNPGFNQPYSYSISDLDYSSLWIHGSFISQILGATLEGQPLLRHVSEGGRLLWTLIWAIGGVVVSSQLLGERRFKRQSRCLRWVVLGGTLVLTGSLPMFLSYLLLQGGWWLPVIAPMMALFLTGLSRATQMLRERQYESDRRLLQFLEALPLGICVLNQDGSVHYTNAMADAILGEVGVPGSRDALRRAASAYISETEQHFPPEKTPASRALEGLPSKGYTLDIELQGDRIPLEMWGTPILDRQGTVTFAVVAFQDISARRQANASQEQATRDLFQVNQDLDRALNMEVQLTDAAARFVPHEFLSFLGYESLVDVKLGEAVAKEMSILFSDIRDFTMLSEKMTLEDNFNFINAYLSRMEPTISENNGFIDKYIGDAIMALFGGGADDAVRAAIAMLDCLTEYNKTRQRPGRPPLRIGIGINTGSLMLGIVGGQHHLDTTVISDAVNLASRIEGLTKIYGTPLLISHDTFLQLEDTNCYMIRLIDRVSVKGKSEKVSVFEVFDADPPDIKHAKLEERTHFEQAVLLYHVQQYAEAKTLFEHCLNKIKHDRPCEIYLERCAQGNKTPWATVDDSINPM
ncbi:CHASE2 domain-containing protein [Sodalinema gerasimenkoae]|uniref:CHASE2 domain-containing protein n=1 Tax=Sodalinema gerasimenkoae TaxID=2862348 RepID=UPI00135B5E7F|nr:CHASE2 domain-containing protein [Sodalinema gerasimenkoae]